MTTTKLVTADELYVMLDDLAHRYELLRGELVPMSPTGRSHTVIAAIIASELMLWARRTGLSEVAGADGGFIISRGPDTVFVPDAAFTRFDRLPAESDPEKDVPVPPDLAVEVVSPNDRRRNVAAKVGTYLRAGVRFVWVVGSRARTVTVHAADAESRTLGRSDTLDGGDALPGFSVAVTELFPL